MQREQQISVGICIGEEPSLERAGEKAPNPLPQPPRTLESSQIQPQLSLAELPELMVDEVFVTDARGSLYEIAQVLLGSVPYISIVHRLHLVLPDLNPAILDGEFDQQARVGLSRLEVLEQEIALTIEEV